MRRSLYWLAAIAVSTSICNTVGRRRNNEAELVVEERILGGHKVAITDYPYIVSVQVWGLHKCGGSIISECVVLTAAHCLQFGSNAYKYSIQYGVAHIGGTKNIIYASNIRNHPQFNYSTKDYDVGLIFLLRAIEFGTHAQCIGLATYRPRTGSPASVAGWGIADIAQNLQTDLRAVTVHIQKQSECMRIYSPWYITPRMLCAGEHLDGKDSCGGDSGGPLVVDGVQVGIVSFGIHCGENIYPGVYTNVAVVRSWIQSNV